MNRTEYPKTWGVIEDLIYNGCTSYDGASDSEQHDILSAYLQDDSDIELWDIENSKHKLYPEIINFMISPTAENAQRCRDKVMSVVEETSRSLIDDLFEEILFDHGYDPGESEYEELRSADNAMRASEAAACRSDAAACRNPLSGTHAGSYLDAMSLIGKHF